MNSTLHRPESASIASVLETVLARIAPLWPLRNAVAVNPYLGWLDLPFERACADHLALRGTPVTLPSQGFAEAWRDGRIRQEHLDAVSDQVWPRSRLLALIQEGAASAPGVCTYSEFLDRRTGGRFWDSLVRDEITKHLSALLDEAESLWRNPLGGRGLHEAWREAALADLSPEASGLAGFRGFLAALPQDAGASIVECVQRLRIDDSKLEHFLLGELYSVAGWASYLRFLERDAAMAGGRRSLLPDLLAIRLTYDAALHWASSDETGVAVAWKEQLNTARSYGTLAQGLCRWQQAYELVFLQGLVPSLLSQSGVSRASRRPAIQAVFCIDVRSEPVRRHLERVHTSLETLGFAGFFGFPVGYRNEQGLVEARCPVLLRPTLELGEACGDARRESVAATDSWRAVQTSGPSAFGFVENLGLCFVAGLGLRQKPACSRRSSGRLTGDANFARRIAWAEAALRGMSLTEGFARLVLLCGHGSGSANNPHSSGLECGACGGHAGDLNARVAAECLNDPVVRSGLSERGLSIPSDTWFVGGFHNTLTDELEILEAERIPETHSLLAEELRLALGKASACARAERLQRQGLGPVAPRSALARLLRRAEDPSELQPEWGLAGNAAFIAAPRERTRDLDLGGRCFLHEYIAGRDPDGSVLRNLLSAPVIVASWINLQYHASSADPEHYGAGDKRLHNVIGGFGVLEGAGGDLRGGLPLQSVFEGASRRHEPLRLSVFVEADRSRIAEALASAPDAAQLFTNGWARLFALEGPVCQEWTPQGWVTTA